MATVPRVRIREINQAPVRAGGDHIIYWMIAARRRPYNFALQRAVELARELGAGLVILEALRVGYRWASDRLHAFVIQGMIDNARAFAGAPVCYYPYVEPEPGAGSGLLEALAEHACAVVTDDFPCFFMPRMVAAAGARLGVRLEAVDGNGIHPMAATDRVFTTAASFRRHLQHQLPAHIGDAPPADPLARVSLPAARVPDAIARRWPAADLSAGWAAWRRRLGALPIDHSVAPVRTAGGARAARARLEAFIDERLPRYGQARNHPDEDMASGLSPYLHFGHISAHQVVARVLERDDWTPERLAAKPTGRRAGWWGASPGVEAFLDQLITWRELGFNMCAHRSDYAEYRSLPGWALDTLADHAGDAREEIYTGQELAAAATSDPIWNAAQRQLLGDGVIHGYLRMLWGKRMLGWTRSPHEALDIMIELNNRYALDGRDPNSYSGIFWILGRYDRAWGPERPVFGKVRYMSSRSTRSKLRLTAYLERWGPGD